MNTFDNFSDFLHMGGYALYVWSAYGIAFGILIGNIFISRKHRKKTLQLLQAKHDTSAKKA